MNVNFLMVCISTFIAFPCYASNQFNHIDPFNFSNVGKSKNKIVGVGQSFKELPDSDLHDVSAGGPCEVCNKLSSTICTKCKNAFYCSRFCQKKDYKEHKRKCYDYYHDEQNVEARKQYSIVANRDENLGFLQYYPKNEQEKCVEFYLVQQQNNYGFIIPEDLKNFIFSISYIPLKDERFDHDLRTGLQVNWLGFPYLNLLKRDNYDPMYLVRLLQYIYQKEDDNQVIDRQFKKCLLQDIARENWLLGDCFCFDLERKFMIALMKVIKKKDYPILREISDMGYDSMKGATRYEIAESYGYATFFFILKKGERGLQYSSIAGRCHLRKRIRAIKNRK